MIIFNHYESEDSIFGLLNDHIGPHQLCWLLNIEWIATSEHIVK